MISVTILTKNSAETLKATLDSAQGFEEVIVLDTGSTDQTIEIAKSYPNVKVFEAPFTGFGELHNKATSLASHEWILSLDSDETLSKELVEEIFCLKLDPGTVYAILRRNTFNGKWIKWCAGWHPDWVIRLYNRSATRFSNDKVHERVISHNLKIKRLKQMIHHTPYRSVSDFLGKMESYSELFAADHAIHKRKVSFTSALFHGWFAFFKSYFLKRGFLGGKEGYIISLYNAQTTFYKYLKLMERQRESAQ